MICKASSKKSKPRFQLSSSYPHSHVTKASLQILSFHLQYNVCAYIICGKQWKETLLPAKLNHNTLPTTLFTYSFLHISYNLPKSIESIIPVTAVRWCNTVFGVILSVNSMYCSESNMIIWPEKFKMFSNFRIKELPLCLDSSHYMRSEFVLETNIF